MNVKRSSTVFTGILLGCIAFTSAVYSDSAAASGTEIPTSQQLSSQEQSPQQLPQDSRVPGGLAVISLPAAHKNQKRLNITFNNKPVWQISHNNQQWAVIGIPLNQKPGDLTYFVNDKPQTITIKDKAYREQHLTVKKKHANPPARDMKRINKESRLSQEAFKLFTDINQNSPYHQFITPAQGPISSPFGLKRFFNEQARRPHSGLDLAAPRGSDIVAPYAGKIVLTGNFFFNGNSIFIDHGQGLVTMYCHMDKLESQQGQWVEAGEVIGKVGATGRVTGPHLHWTVSLNNTRVDPLLFIAPPAE